MTVIAPLGFWGRILVVVIGSSIVLTSVILVACIVGPGCFLNRYFLSENGCHRRRRKSREKDKLAGLDPPLIYYKGVDTPSEKSPSKQTNGLVSQFRRLTPPILQNGGGEQTSLLGSLSTKRDSTYSSMSENSGRTSPTNSCRSSAEGSLGSGGGSVVGSPTGGDAQGQVSFGIQFVVTNEELGTGKLIITIMEAYGLPVRQYMGGSCDPYVRVIVWKEKRSLRKTKSSPIKEFKTRILRHTSNPSFNQSFVMEASKHDLKDLMIKLVAMDSDKWVSSTTLGEVVQPLKDIKTLATNLQRTTLNFFLAPPKLELGEILFGVSYLPTAQRLSVSVIKANHLHYGNVVDDITDFCPYVRVLLLTSSGKLIRKKKTTFKTNTDKPVWNETLIFDMAQNQIENITFVLAVCTRPHASSATTMVSEAISQVDKSDALHTMMPLSPNSRSHAPQDPFGQKKADKYVGKVVLGNNVNGTEEAKHWASVLAAPRKIFTQWHSLK